MAATVSIAELIYGFESQGNEAVTKVNRETGEVKVIETRFLSMAENEDTPPGMRDWERDELALAGQMMGDTHWLTAPSAFDIHEWQIMKDFANSVQSAKVRGELDVAIHGRGAFRAFKIVIGHHHLFEDWNAFRDNALRDLAIEWCEENGFAWKDK